MSHVLSPPGTPSLVRRAPQAATIALQHGRSRILTELRSSSSGLLLLAVLVGLGAGGGAIVFRWLIETFTLVLSGHGDYSLAGHAAHPSLPGLGRWFVIGAPVVAGLLYGPLVHFFAREARGHGVPEVMYAVARNGGRIKPQVAAVKALASALCIGGGGSVGREGPIVQIGSALGSTLGRVVRVSEPRMRLLVACGAAGGIAATFNAPLAGVFFAMELILVNFEVRSFGMIVLASVTASVVGRAAMGSAPFLRLPDFTVGHLWEYGLFAILGLLGGVAGVLFTRVLYAIEDLCDRLWHGPEWLRPAAGGVLLGLLLLVLPQMYGVGYPVLAAGVAGKYTIAFLLVLLVAKMFATSLTIGIGGSGGVFAPSLFIGAMLGSAFGEIMHILAPAVAGPVGAYGLIGMGAVFAGAARAPITAVIIMFELTGEYTIILPLMSAIVLATFISQRIAPRDTIYTLKLRRRGVDLSSPAQTSPRADAIPISAVMRPVPTALRDNESLLTAARSLAHSPQGVLPVVDAHGAYCGTVSALAVAEALADGEHDASHIAEVTDLPAALRSGDPLDLALKVLDDAGGAVPVLNPDGRQIVGWITHQAALGALRPATVRAPGRPLRSRPGQSRMPPTRLRAGRAVSRHSPDSALGVQESGPLHLPGLEVDLAAGKPTVEDRQMLINSGAGRCAAAAGEKPDDQPRDQPEQEKPEHTHTKPPE